MAKKTVQDEVLEVVDLWIGFEKQKGLRSKKNIEDFSQKIQQKALDGDDVLLIRCLKERMKQYKPVHSVDERQNKYDNNGQSLEAGLKAEANFVTVAKKYGYQLVKSTDEQDMRKHFDYVLLKDDVRTRVDVKARKKIARGNKKTQDDWVWLEFKNVRGNPGWIYGQADKIAFETEKEFILIDRQKLINLAQEKIDFNQIVDRSDQAQYKTYRRFNRPSELVGLIAMDDIKNSDHIAWSKY